MNTLFNLICACSIGEGDGTPLQYSCLESPMNGGAWWAAVLGVAKSWAWLSVHFQFSLSCIGEGNGNPLQCSCLENPRDGGACWAAIYGVAQSRTRLKRLNSSRAHCVPFEIIKVGNVPSGYGSSFRINMLLGRREWIFLHLTFAASQIFLVPIHLCPPWFIILHVPGRYSLCLFPFLPGSPSWWLISWTAGLHLKPSFSILNTSSSRWTHFPGTIHLALLILI